MKFLLGQWMKSWRRSTALNYQHSLVVLVLIRYCYFLHLACVDLVQFQLKRPATDPVIEKPDMLEKTREDFLPTDDEQSIINKGEKSENNKAFMVKSRNFPVQSEKQLEMTNISSANVLFIDHGVKLKENQINNFKQNKGKKDKRSAAELENFSLMVVPPEPCLNDICLLYTSDAADE